MERLRDLQRRFSRTIRESMDPILAEEILPAGRLDTPGALQVYKTAYPSRLTESLGDTFETVWRVLGDEGFFSVCREYISVASSYSHNLSDFGETFSRFLRTARPDLPFLESLADFEWRLKNMFHRIQEPSVDTEAWQADLEDRIFVFGADSEFLDYSWPVHELWTHREKTQFPDIDLKASERFCMYKTGLAVSFEFFSEAAFEALRRLRNGRTLSESLENSKAPEGEISVLFAWLVESGIVKGFR